MGESLEQEQTKEQIEGLLKEALEVGLIVDLWMEYSSRVSEGCLVTGI